MGGHPTGGEVLKQSSRDLAVELPLARQFGLFEGVEGRGVILELNRHQVGAIGGIDPLGLAFVEERTEAVGRHGWGSENDLGAWPPGERGERNCRSNSA